ncbi:hypothetical protein [Achromobacter spanius]|nr:hypothetical protein [Achromobacter spanius]
MIITTKLNQPSRFGWHLNMPERISPSSVIGQQPADAVNPR